MCNIVPLTNPDLAQLRELWNELMPGEFEDHKHPVIVSPRFSSFDRP